MRALVVVSALLMGCVGHRGDAPAPATSIARGALTWGPTPNGVDTPVVGLTMTATTPRMAFDGRQFLAVWQDFRGIAATRISTAGKLADDANFFIPPAGNGRATPDVASDGTSFYVVWADDSQGSAWKIRGAQVQVGPDGALTAGDPVTIATPAGTRDASVPRIAFGGGSYGVVWFEDGYPSWRVMFTRISPTGAPLDATPAVLAESTVYNFVASQADDVPDIVWIGGAFVPAWMQFKSDGTWSIAVCRAVTATSLSVPVNAVTGAATTRGGGVALAFDGTRVWVAWEEFDGTGSAGADGGSAKGAVRIRRMRVDGGTEDAAFTAQPTDPLFLYQPALAFEGAGGAMALAHADHLLQQVTFQRLAADTGAPLLSPIPVVSTGPTAQDKPVLVHGGGTTLLAWRTNDEVLGTRLSGAGVPQDAPPIPIARSLNAEFQPAAAGNADGFAVAWLDTRLGKRRIFGAALSPDGAPTLPAALSVIGTPNALNLHALGAGAGQFLAVGIASGLGFTGLPLVGQRFGLDGTLRGNLITVAASQLDSTRVVFGNGVFLVVGYAQGAPAPLDAVRVDSSGNVLGTTVVTSIPIAGSPTAASDGTRFLVVWPTGSGLSGRLLGGDGTLQGSTLPLTPSGGTWTGTGAALAFGGGAYLLVWSAGLPDRTIMGEVVSTGGAVTAGPFAISSHASGEVDLYPGVAFDGTRFVVAWKTLQTHDGGLATAHEIRDAPVSAAGVVGKVGFVASDDGSGTLTDAVAVAGGTAGRALVAYTGADAPAGYALARTRIRFLGAAPGPLGGGCASDGDCAQGTCADGVCCASACAGGTLDCQACSVVAGAAANGTCAPVPDGRSCGTRGLCAAAVCVEMDAGQPPARDGSVDRSVDASVSRTDAGRGGPADAAADRPGSADAHPMPDAARAPDGAAGAGGTGGPPTGSGSGGGCSCATAGAGAGPGALFWVCVAALLLTRRRRGRARLSDATSLTSYR